MRDARVVMGGVAPIPARAQGRGFCAARNSMTVRKQAGEIALEGAKPLKITP